MSRNVDKLKAILPEGFQPWLIARTEERLQENAARVERAKKWISDAEAEVVAARDASRASEKVVGGVRYVGPDGNKRWLAAGRAVRAANVEYYAAVAQKHEIEVMLSRAKAGLPEIAKVIGDAVGFGGNALLMGTPGDIPDPAPEALRFSEAVRQMDEEAEDRSPSKWRRLRAMMGLPVGVVVRTGHEEEAKKEHDAAT